MLKLRTKNINITDANYLAFEDKIEKIRQVINLQDPIYKKYLGWENDYYNHFEDDFLKMQDIYNKWNDLGIKTVVAIGIGGSFYGANSALEMLSGDNSVEIIFLTNNSNDKIQNTITKLKNKNWGIVVISKSGTTLETSINFKIIRHELYAKYKKMHNKRIVCITSNTNSKLNDIAIKHNYHTLAIPHNIGGRFSALTPVGTFLMLLKKIDVKAVIEGSLLMKKDFQKNLLDNDCIKYSILRNFLYKKNYLIEVFTAYEENFYAFLDVYKQLFAESEGKIAEVCLPTTSKFTDDLHSIGQLYQSGPKNLFVTSLLTKTTNKPPYTLKSDYFTDDNLSYLDNFNLNEITNTCAAGVTNAFADIGNIPNVILETSFIDAKFFGYLFMFFCYSASVSSMLNGVNPYDQPGVEHYKTSIFDLLKKKK